MGFGGRKRKIAAVVKSLKQKRNVVLTGRYGVGRSSLVNQIARLHKETWQFLFADFSKSRVYPFSTALTISCSARPAFSRISTSHIRSQGVSDRLMIDKKAPLSLA
jgi:AAA+ ATPase superfamily predicted ATPase